MLEGMRVIQYRGGIAFVTRADEPTYQCKECYKPWFDNDLSIRRGKKFIKCPHCSGRVRKLTDKAPLIRY